MKKIEYDFFNNTSWPSSLKLINTVKGEWLWFAGPPLDISPESTINVNIMASQKAVIDAERPSSLVLSFWDGKKWQWLDWKKLPLNSFDFSKFTLHGKVPLGISIIRIQVAGGPGTEETPGITWFDDLTTYQNGVLISENKFTGLGPLISIPAPILAGVGLVKLKK